ncbi:MAG: DUF599 domain-containing protein [Proteobacteria bacterium]|nr:DUF599 domain-containing protein [Pseudomonadota bacterium]MCL2307809.1 DUF599 domain-containing protein [Pseudomonadota bacterium]
MLERLVTLFTPADWAALLFFMMGWIGYSTYADRAAMQFKGLQGVTHKHRLAWAQQMVHRDNRMPDVSLIGNLMRSTSFYANTTIYIVAGLLAIAGALDRLVVFTEELPFARQTSREILEAKIFLLAGIFIFAYFKFTWSIRQFNSLSILTGSAPSHLAPTEELERHAERCGQVNSLAGDEFNRGIRAYYFGFAALGWFIHPAVFVAFTLWVLAILWRRDFRSKTLRAMQEP